MDTKQEAARSSANLEHEADVLLSELFQTELASKAIYDGIAKKGAPINSDEYQSLRQELLDSYNREVNLAAFTFTAASAAIGYGFTAQNTNPIIFLLPVLILGLLLVQINNSIYTILSVSVYIRIFIEDGSDRKWERAISTLRSILRKRKRYNPLTLFTEIHYAVAAIVMGLICIVLSLLYSSSWYQYTISIIVALGWLTYCVVMFRPIAYANSGLYEQELERDFGQIKDEIGNKERSNQV